MKTLIEFFTVFVLVVGATSFVGCGGGGGAGGTYERAPCVVMEYNKSNLPPEPSPHSFDDNALYYQQWSIHYDNIFYNYNHIDPDASIHMDGNHTFTGKAIKVAVIDDALDTTHEDLQGAVVRTYDVKTQTTDVTPHTDGLNHGTEVTGLIAGRNNDLGIIGVAPEVDIYFIRLPFEGMISIDDIVEAFEKAKEWGADVINCSWGSGDVSDAVRNTIEAVVSSGREGKGTIVVFAAGNDNQDIGNDESSLPQVFAIGATNKDNLRASYSNYGQVLDFMAPGGEYLGLTTLDQMGSAGNSSDPNEPNYILYSDSDNAFAGTSAAAPIVTGVVAQLLQANPNLTTENLYNALACSADKIGGVVYKNGFNKYYGYGKVNVNEALRLVR